jgi:hypothetical protein
MYLPADLRKQLEAVDDHRCAYCQTTQANSGQPMVVDHVIPTTKGGVTSLGNLCFACRRCNEYKGSQIAAPDPLTGKTSPLFHPRQHRWLDHFAWDGSTIQLIGLTPIGRTTIGALNMNNPVIVAARSRWASAGWHPPQV